MKVSDTISRTQTTPPNFFQMNQSEVFLFSCTRIYNHHLKRFNFSCQKQRLDEASQRIRKATNLKMMAQNPSD